MQKLQKLRGRFISILLLCALVIQSQAMLASDSEKLPAELLLQKSKDSVVTVFTSANHGSGVLIDESGLILTSSDTIKDGEGYLCVEFESGQVLKANVITNDNALNIAVIRVNPKIISNKKTLQLVANDPDELKNTGANILIVGSNPDRMQTEKQIWRGKISCVVKEKALLDTMPDFALSGGPVLSESGRFIGLFGIVEDDAKIKGQIIPANLMAAHILHAKEISANIAPPTGKLQPDMPKTPFKLSELLHDHPELLKEKEDSSYCFDTNYFSIAVMTPLKAHLKLHKPKVSATMFITGAGEKAGLPTEENYWTSEKYYEKPLVTVMVIPKQKFIKNSKVYNGLMLGAIFATSVVVPLSGLALIPVHHLIHDKKGVKKDFLQMSLVDADDNKVADAVESGKAPITKAAMTLTGFDCEALIDKTHMGIYTFDAHCFETDKPLKLAISSEGSKSITTIDIPEKIKKQVVSDFKPYWEYVAKRAEPKVPQM